MDSLDKYIHDFVREDALLQQVRHRIVELNMPPISVNAELGRLLTILVKTSGAHRILEIGALGGYSGICLARGLRDGGTLESLELNPQFAEVAREHIAQAGHAHQVTVHVGPALEQLEAFAREDRSFDFYFIDADKPNYPMYLDYAVQLAKPGALIIADNVLLKGRVLDPENQDPSPTGMKVFNEHMSQHPRLESTLLPVRDGFAIARVKE